MAFSKFDYQMMTKAIRFAKKGKYTASPNPIVGCVITKNKKIISYGYHKKAGAPHAEVNAINNANQNIENSTMYITLEPCSHYGRTPPCADAIVTAGIKKVIIATLDPNPKVTGLGVDILKNANIKVKTGLLANKAQSLNKGFFKRMVSKRPYITCKIAMSLDGKIALSSGESKWITSKYSRLDVQKLRARSDAILTGVNTVIYDNPNLTVRDIKAKAPIRVILDTKNKTKGKNLNIFSNNAKTLIFNNKNTKTDLNNGKLDLKDVVTKLAKLEINNVLLETGPKLAGSMLKKGLIDEFIIYIAPILMGSSAKSMLDIKIDKMLDKINLDIKNIQMIANDIKITALPR